MQTLQDLGNEYLDTALDLRIRLEKLKLEKKSMPYEQINTTDLERRIDYLYAEILQMTDIGNHLLRIEQRR